jgi:hypothetical protein
MWGTGWTQPPVPNPGPQRYVKGVLLVTNPRGYIGGGNQCNIGLSEQFYIGGGNQCNIGLSDQFYIGGGNQCNIGLSDQFYIGGGVGILWNSVFFALDLLSSFHIHVTLFPDFDLVLLLFMS